MARVGILHGKPMFPLRSSKYRPYLERTSSLEEGEEKKLQPLFSVFRIRSVALKGIFSFDFSPKFSIFNYISSFHPPTPTHTHLTYLINLFRTCFKRWEGENPERFVFPCFFAATHLANYEASGSILSFPFAAKLWAELIQPSQFRVAA